MKEKGLEMGLIMGKGEFVPYLQPVCDVEKVRIVAAEVVPRQKDGRYVFCPRQFMKRVEVCGQIDKLDLFMLQSVCRLLSRWDRFGLKLFVAQSWKTLCLPGYLRELRRLALHHKIDPADLVIEITDGEAEQDERLDIVAAIRNAGFPVAMEHFGVNGASLSLLVRTQAEFIKLDERLLDTKNAQWSEALLESLLYLTRLLKIRLICQDMKTSAQRAMTQRVGCQLIQGTRTGRAMTPKQFERLLEEWDLPDE